MFLRKRLYFPLVKRPGREVASSAEVESNWSSTIMAWTRETLYILYIYIYIYIYVCVCIYKVSQEERTKLREGVPYVKLYGYNPKHLCPKLNGY